MLSPTLTPRVCERALNARDPRFDGVFFVGITTTGIYCRPVCPSRFASSRNRRFFESTMSAERAGFRPCLRCRPELAPGRAPMDAISRLARAAASRIEAGGLNGRGLAQLAAEFGVTPRHLRRVLEREFGVTPLALARSYRLLLAKRLLTDTRLSITRIAYASGFQSLRRFNTVFREQYRMAPGALRAGRSSRRAADTGDTLYLTLSYRAPFAWNGLLQSLGRGALPGVAALSEHGYARTVRIEGCTGTLVVENRPGARHLRVGLSMSLVPALMPLIPRLRRLFDLDADPDAIDEHLARHGLADQVRRHPGVRLAGTLDPFEPVLQSLVREAAPTDIAAAHALRRLVWTLGEPIETDIPGLTRLTPLPVRVTALSPAEFAAMGLPHGGDTIAAVARALAQGELRLDAGADGETVQTRLEALGVTPRAARSIAGRVAGWPDAFPPPDRELARAAGVTGPRALAALAEGWRPWRAYGATLLRLAAGETLRQRPAG